MYGRNGKTRNEKGKEGAAKIITRFTILRLRLKTITNIITVRSNAENNMIGSQRGFVGAMFQGEKGEERRDVVGRGIWEWETY